MQDLKVTKLTRDLTLNITSFIPTLTGQLTVRQDNVGGHAVLLGASIAGVTMVGDVPVLPTPLSETLIKWLCTDNTVYVYSELSPDYSTIITGGTGGGTINAYTKTESDARFYPLTTNPTGYITAASLNNYYTRAQSDLRYLNQTGGTGTNDYNLLINKPFVPTNTNQLTNGAGFITGYNEVDTLDSVLTRGNTSNKNMNVSGAVNLSGSLQIPINASTLNQSIWIGNAASTGSTGGGSGVSYLAALLDTQITSPLNGQALVYNGSKWTNTIIVTDLSSVYTKSESNSLYKPIGYTPAWSDISGRPTALSQFSNDAGFITSFTETDTLNSVLSRGNTSGLNMAVTGKVSLTGELILPINASSSNQSIWIGNASSTGSTGGGSGASYLSALLDTQISAPANGQALVFNGSKWANSNVVTDLTNVHKYYTFTADASSVPEHTSNFSYAVNAPNVGTLMHFGANGYGTQFNTNYGNGTQLHFRTRNGDAGTWNSWFKVWSNADFVPTVQASASTVVQRDPNGYIFNSYINTTDDVQGGSLGYIIGKLNSGDNYHRSFTAGAVQSWLGLGASAYMNETLATVTARGNSTSSVMGIAFDGVGHDPYGAMSVTRGTSSSFSYYGMTRSGVIGWGIGMDTSNRIAFGTGGNSGNNYTFTGIHHTFDAAGTATHTGRVYGNDFMSNSWYYTNGQSGLYSSTYSTGFNPMCGGAWQLYSDYSSDIALRMVTAGGNIRGYLYADNANNVGLLGYDGGWGLRMDSGKSIFVTTNATVNGSLTVAGTSNLSNTRINNGSVFYQYNADNSYAFQSDMRGDTLHQYVNRVSDGAALQYKTNWWDGTKYHSWTMDSLGFVANSKITTISSGNGATTYQGSLEVRGTNAGITFHYPAYYAAPLYMDSAGTLVWSGPQFQANTVYGASAVRSAGWLYSNGSAGWYNETYGGGMYMVDSTYLRTYNGKAFYCDNFIQSPRIHATSTMVLPLSPSSENGAIWIA